MGEIKGFLKHKRQEVGHRAVAERVHDFGELDLPLTPDAITGRPHAAWIAASHSAMGRAAHWVITSRT
jgi:hypothetical protein